jgi:Tfp pilus assembly protein PilF
MRYGLVLMAGLFGLAGCISPTPERVRAYSDDAMTLYQRGEYAAARESFQAALALQPDDVTLLYDVGQCCDHLGQTAQAQQFFNECLTRDANHAPSRHALAAALVRQGRWADASRMADDWLRRSPQLAGPYALDGWLWHQAGDLPRAQARLQQALERDPKDTKALTELALVYEGMQRPDRALVLYERALQQDPKQPEVAKRRQFLLTSGAARPQPDE